MQICDRRDDVCFYEKLLPLPAGFHTTAGKFDQKVPCLCRDKFYVVLFGIEKLLKTE